MLPEGLNVGDKIKSLLALSDEELVDSNLIQVGAALPLKKINDGSLVFSVEL